LLVKPEGDRPLHDVTAARVAVIEVVPAVFVQLALDERLAHQELNLSPRHADLKLISHFLGDEVALMNIRAIYITVEVATGH
jgi:hypothetical protein